MDGGAGGGLAVRCVCELRARSCGVLVTGDSRRLLCRAGAHGGALRARAARARPGRRQAAHAALRRPGLPRDAHHWPPGTLARSRRTSQELCKPLCYQMRQSL